MCKNAMPARRLARIHTAEYQAYTRLVLICTSCGNENPEAAKFCNACAAPLAEVAPAPALDERKIVSVLFCDLVGFTESSERQDPEDVQARLRPYHARIRQDIERYGGTVEKFVGDAVMAVFGAPVAHEDDAERAVRAGLTILDAIVELNETDLDLQVRVGINTGEAVVSLAARPELGEGLVAGDVVNTAARIQTVGPVNAVAVSEQTYRTTSRVFEYEPLEPVSVKGKSEPVALWRPKASHARFGTDIARQFKTPLVGRELEKPLLIGIFERATQLRSVQLVTVVGEPGVGKTRLISELFGHIEARPGIIRWRQGRCLPYGEGITFWALGEIVKAEGGILESDSAEAAVAKLNAAVSPEESERQWLVQRLSPLVGVEAASPAERQELFTAWRRFFEDLAASRSTVLVFEDLHWADEALLAFLAYLAEWSEGVPLLIVCAARPELYERRPGWGAGLRNAHVINLSPLSDQETAELVSHLTSATKLTSELARAVLERAGGNPLYAEEFVRLLADGGLEADETILPDTVQALIAARLDTLTPERKSLLQDAAVVGKVFWEGAVAEIGGRDPSEVELALHELARKELVRPVRRSSMEGEREYAFWHLLVRDVAYAQIPRVERGRRHRAAAAWIERKAGKRVEDLAEVLAYHYQRSLELAVAAGDAAQAEELTAPARRFLALAGERALGLDTAQAEARLARALELTPRDNPERPALVVRWAEAAFQSGRFLEAADALDEGLPLFRSHGEAETAARALHLRSRLSHRLGDGRQVALAAEAVALLEAIPPGAALVAAYEQLAHAQWTLGAHAETIAAADRAASLAKRLGLPVPARALGYRGLSRTYLGHADGIAEMERALGLALERGAAWDAGTLKNNIAFAGYPLYGPTRSLVAFEDGIAFCQERGLAIAAALETNWTNLLVELGRVDEALDRVARLAAAAEERGETHELIELRGVELAIRLARNEQAAPTEVEALVESARQHGSVDNSTFAFASAAAAAVENNAPERVRALLAELEQLNGSHNTPYYARLLPQMVRTALAAGDSSLARRLADGLELHYPLHEHALCTARAELAEHAGEREEAARLYAEAAGRWREFGNLPERAYALLGEGRCLLALADPEAAQPLREALELFASMGYQPALSETAALLEQTTAASAS
jgi:class 3 adenylate cyclase